MNVSDGNAFLSPSWFAEKAKESKYVVYENKAKDELEWFSSQYGPEQLRNLSGKELLEKMFYGENNYQNNLCYALEMNPGIRDDFGSISGGSAFKFGLFFHNQKKVWMTGSAQKPVELTVEEAIAQAEEVRDNLLAGAEEIAKFPSLQTQEDYAALEEKVAKHIRTDTLWILKYYKMIFPDYFQATYAEYVQRHMLYAFQIQPADTQFVRMGQIALFTRDCGISVKTNVLGQIFGDTVGWYKPIFRIGTGTVQNDVNFSDWKEEGYCALGFDEIGDCSAYLDENGKADKERIASALLENNSSHTKSTASVKAGEIIDFIEAENGETIVVAMNGQQLLGIGMVKGSLYYENDSRYGNRRQTEWLYVASSNVKLPVFEGRLTTFKRMSNPENMMLIYKLLYHHDEAESDLWWPPISEYDPEISKEKWIELLHRDDVIGPVWGGALAAFYLHGPATCTEIGNIYNRSPFGISGICTGIAKQVYKITSCPISKREDGQNRYWTILFQGQNAGPNQAGGYAWKLRPELYDALSEFGIEKYEWVPETEAAAWLLIWNPNMWQWPNYEEAISNTRNGDPVTSTWSCSSTQVKPGDRVYLSVCGKGVNRGIVASGFAKSAPQMRDHWDPDKKAQGQKYRSIEVEFDKLVDYRSEDILPIEVLQKSFPSQSWSSQSSGIRISPAYAKALNDMWLNNEKPVVCFHTGFESSFPRNRIVFGAPGTGKSFLLNSQKDELLESGGSFERVTFHPDYTYAHFVGTYKPVPCKDEEGRSVITYQYVPGPFMRVYVKALRSGRDENPRPCLLLIEEINRANPAAVFGDVFQLLDRDDNDVSEYAIQPTEDMKRYLADELGGAPQDYEEIRLLDNMFIWASMNSADQGVFPMDTAFKRRWDFTYLSIDTGEAGIAGKKVTLGSGEYTRDVEWNALRHAINNRLSSFRLNEDKLIGPYFLSRRIVPSDGEIDPVRFADAFRSKVLMYLYEDAARQKRSSLFADDVDVTRYSAVCEAFDEKGVFAFCSEISVEFQVPEMPPESDPS